MLLKRLTPLKLARSVCQGREEGEMAWVRLGASHARLTSHPAVTFVCFHVYLKKDKRYDC